MGGCQYRGMEGGGEDRGLSLEPLEPSLEPLEHYVHFVCVVCVRCVDDPSNQAWGQVFLLGTPVPPCSLARSWCYRAHWPFSGAAEHTGS